MLEHPTDHAIRGVHRLSALPDIATLRRRERLQAVDGHRARLFQCDAQIEVTAVRGVRRLTHRLQWADEPVHVRLVGAEDVQKDVAQGPARGRLRAKPLLVDPVYECQEIRSRPVEPSCVAGKRGGHHRLEILRPHRLTRKHPFGVVLREASLDRLAGIDPLTVPLEVAQVGTDGLRRGGERLVGGVGLHHAAEEIKDVQESLLALRPGFQVEVVPRHSHRLTRRYRDPPGRIGAADPPANELRQVEGRAREMRLTVRDTFHKVGRRPGARLRRVCPGHLPHSVRGLDDDQEV